MARPTSITKEKILDAAIDIVRKGNASALTARRLSSAMGCGVNAIFSKFGSMEGVIEAVRAKAHRLFKERVGAGLSLNPPFKGFGMAFLWFAMDEPELYKLVMESTVSNTSFEDYIDTHIGFKQECLDAINQSFELQEKTAEMLYYQMIIVALGLAHTCVAGGAQLNISQASEILGKSVRAFLMVIHAGNDERESFINLTRGDIRLIILSRLRFSVSEQALLLSISPASVTKARQRLKAKLGTTSQETLSCF